MTQTQDMQNRAVNRVIEQFASHTGVDIRLYHDALEHVTSACEFKMPELLRTGRTDIVLPCIIRTEQGYLHLDVTLFLDDISGRGGC